MHYELKALFYFLFAQNHGYGLAIGGVSAVFALKKSLYQTLHLLL